MSITVTGRKMPVTDALREYAEDKIGNSMKVMDINPLDAEVVLHVEKNPANATPAICEVTLRTKGLNDQLKDVAKQREALDVRMDAAAKRYRTQFVALDSLMAQMTSTSSALAQQLSALSAQTSNR